VPFDSLAISSKAPGSRGEYEIALREAYEAGRADGMIAAETSRQYWRDAEREVRRMLYAIVFASHPTPVRVPRVAIAALDTRSSIMTHDDPATGEVVLTVDRR
jgi:hypothetical protein